MKGPSRGGDCLPAEDPLFRGGRSYRISPGLALILGLALAGSPSLAASPQPDPAVSIGTGAATAFPRLGSLGPDDTIYRQQQEQLAASYTALKAGGAQPELTLYIYKTKSGTDLFSLAARFNLPYETLATLNRYDRARELSPGESILVPSAPGLFVPETPVSDLDFMMSCREGYSSAVAGAQAGTSQGSALALSLGPESPGGERHYFFFRGERFRPEERALFLGALFRFPLPTARLTSGFGLRSSPVNGRTSMHEGIDLAAPAGTDVYAVREGIVSASGLSPVLGEYLIIDHVGGWQSVYGHLSIRLVRLNDQVESGMIIGRVGSTGLSTGPHLHFEVRNRGEARNPEPLIPKGKR